MVEEEFARDPGWFEVVGGPPPAEVAFRDALLTLLPPVAVLLCSLWLSLPLRVVCFVLATVLLVVLSLETRRRWRRQQGVRVVGNVLEHRSGQRVARVALTRAVISSASASPGMLVLVVDDGQTHLALGRRAEPHEISGLPSRLGPYLELMPEDFEEVRIAAHRSYPRA